MVSHDAHQRQHSIYDTFLATLSVKGKFSIMKITIIVKIVFCYSLTIIEIRKKYWVVGGGSTKIWAWRNKQCMAPKPNPTENPAPYLGLN